MTDLYKLLGLPRTCGNGEIRTAYRRLAKRWHPDRPRGSEEKFEALKLAHDVLMNPERRAYYDSTGKITSSDPDAGRGPALAAIASALAFCVDAALKQGIDLKTEDLINALCAVIAKRKSEIDERLAAMAKQSRVYTELAGRFVGRDGDDAIDALVTGKLSAMAEEERRNTGAKAHCDEALKIINSHTFRRDILRVQQIPPGWQHATGQATQGFQAMFNGIFGGG